MKLESTTASQAETADQVSLDGRVAELAGESAGPTRNVYVVDEDEQFRASIVSMLAARPGVVVRGFRSARAFMEQAHELEGGIVILDDEAHPTGAADVMQVLAPCDHQFLFVVVSAHSTIKGAVRAMKAGAFEFLEKPCGSDTLISTLEPGMVRFERNRRVAIARIRASEALARLSPRELEVLKGLIDGCSSKQIAQELSLSPRTIEIHRAKLMNKLGVGSMSEALRLAFTAGLLRRV
ncbi:response regulator transcription factor [Sphingomonas aerophila]|uniref:Two-component system response regulator FixJ n=1 Tax=Sphingomonas aerophila TaxID=1344948 RepID=A0A7W9BAM1_9SPHN|nr:LuxR C-terminal-related transcriptional regulator [Sphingomonas aerophila]MBB5713665.1 two-component system response regulator FixJ [Sphingomonas aerophila]